MAPDHYGNAVFTNTAAGAVVVYNPLTIVTSYFDRPKDIRFLIDQLEEFNNDAQSDYYERLDLRNLFLTGHSYGGLTSLLGGVKLEKIKGIAPLNPLWIGNWPSNFSKPLFMLQGGQDNVVGDFVEGCETVFNNSASSNKMYIYMPNGGHYSATDACLLLPPSMVSPSIGCNNPSFISNDLANEIVNAYMTAFIRSTMNGDSAYDAYLGQNHYPSDIQFSSTWEVK